MTVSTNVIKAVINTILEKCIESPTAQREGGTAVSTLPKGEEVWLETSSPPNPPSFSGFREYSFLQGLLCLFVGRSIPLPAGIEIAIYQQEAFHGSPTNTCPWGIICS